MHEELINAPLGEALERLKGHDVFVRVLAPPYLAIGKGALRVVRVAPVALEKSSSPTSEQIELTVTYDDYEKLPEQAPKAGD